MTYTPQGLYEAGRAHALSSNLLYNGALERAGDDGHPDPTQFAFNGTYSLSVYFLACLGLELYLKAAFVHYSGDGSDSALKGIGHNLVRALDAAEQAGFHSQAPNLREIVEYLREPHLSESFRYKVPENMELPEVADVIGAIQVIDDELEPLLFPK